MGVMRGVGGAIVGGVACGDCIEVRVRVGKVEDMLVRAWAAWGWSSAMWWPEWCRAMKWPGWWIDIEIHWVCWLENLKKGKEGRGLAYL